MDLLAETNLAFALAKPQRTLASTGVILAVAALLIAVCAPAFMEAKTIPPTDLPHALAHSAVKIKDRLAHKEFYVQPVRPISWTTALMVVGGFAGFLGAARGTASWIRRENLRLSSIAIAAGLTAIAWNYFVVAAVAAASLFVLAWIISHFHR